MWDFFNRVVEGRRMPLRLEGSALPPANKSMLDQYRVVDRTDVLETAATRRQLHQRLSRNKAQELSTITESIADRAEFERKLNMYLRKRNQSQVMTGSKKRRYETPEQRRRQHSLMDDEQISRKESAPSWMKNPKRLFGLPSIEVRFGPVQDRPPLDSFTVSIEPLPRQRRRKVPSRVSPKFFKE